MMMRRRSRARRIAKWTGLAVCVVVAVAWVTSILRNVGYSRGRIDFGLALGGAYGILSEHPGGWGWFNYPGGRFAGVVWSPNLDLRRFGQTPFNGWGRNLFVPLWLPFLLVAIPTFILWRRDRRPPPGHCLRCRYDLTGNVSGRCPECGEVV